MDQHQTQPTRTAAIGWAFVAAQFLALFALVWSGPDNQWPTPTWLQLTSWAMFIVGFAIMATAALGLGLSLTPTPVPRSSARLQTKGLYRFSRHPIYTGLLCVVIAITVRSGSFVTLAIAVGTVMFFDLKARWEERQLALRYPGYQDYASRTPRFVPKPWSMKPSSN